MERMRYREKGLVWAYNSVTHQCIAMTVIILGCSDHLLFGFFCICGITVPTVSSRDLAVHLGWGDVYISDDNRAICMFLKRLITGEVAVLLGITGDELSPLAALSSYINLH